MDDHIIKGRGKKFPYNNRQISWMDFNSRVMEEAFEKENPVMEKYESLEIEVVTFEVDDVIATSETTVVKEETPVAEEEEWGNG